MAFLFILLITLFLMIVVIFSKIRIEITNFRFDSQIKRHLNKNYEIKIKWYLFGLLPILTMKISKPKLEKMKIKEKIKQIDFIALEKTPTLNKQIFETIKAMDIGIKNIYLSITIGTESATLTSFLVPIISTVIAIILRKRMRKFENQTFVINPIYQNQNLVKIDFSGIFEIKMRHIISIIYQFIKKGKKGVKEYERASNRGPYDYSYE